MQVQYERRQHRRIDTVLDATFVPNSDLLFDWGCKSKDLSEGGVRIVSIREPIVGGDIEVAFALPAADDMVKVQAEVVWTRPAKIVKGMFEVGIKFADLADSKRSILRKFISAQASE